MVKNRDSRASLKQEQAKQRRDRLLDEIDQLCTHGRKHLATRQRLQAAHFIREQVDNLICHSHPKWKISDIETELKNRKLAGIRLHRWMVKAPQGSITDELVEKYENRPEPLKKTRVYFKIAEVLARLSEKDPGDTKIALYKRTNLDAQFAPIVRKDGDEEFDPTARLLQLLRNATNDIAHRVDLAGLFQKAERLQAGVSSQNFNEAKTLRNVLQPYTRQTLVAGFWAMDAVPALPSVHLAEYPIAEARNLDFLFRTGEAGTKTRGGDVALTWSLRMAIAPDANHAAEPMIIRTTRLFFIDNCNSTEQLEIHHSGDGFEDLLPVSKWRPFLINEPTTSVSFTRDAAEKFEVIANHRNFYRRSYPDENLPHEDIRCAEIEPLDRFQLQRWFCNGGMREDHEICRGRVLRPLQNGSQDKAAEWFTSPGMARDLELAIRNGQLRDNFLQAIEALERSTNRLATQRLEEMKERDRDLFDQWSAERFALYSQDR